MLNSFFRRGPNDTQSFIESALKDQPKIILVRYTDISDNYVVNMKYWHVKNGKRRDVELDIQKYHIENGTNGSDARSLAMSKTKELNDLVKSYGFKTCCNLY